MKNQLFNMALFVTLFLTASCDNEPRTVVKRSPINIFGKTVDSLFAIEGQNFNSKTPIAYVVLPNTGCGGCISSAEKMFGDFVQRKIPVRFILTNINSLKAVKLNFGDSAVLSPNVYADQSNLIYSTIPELQQIYPVVFYTNHSGEPIRFEYVNPDNPNAIANLNKYVDSAIQPAIVH